MKVKLWCTTHDCQSLEEDIIEVEDNCTDEDLEEYAKDFFYSMKEPSWGFERIKSDSTSEEE